MKKAIIAGASTGIVAGMILMGGNTALAESAELTNPFYAQSTSATGMHMMHRFNSLPKINSLAADLGLDPVLVREEINSGKTLKQVMQDHGIVLSQIDKAFSKKTSRNNKNWRK